MSDKKIVDFKGLKLIGIRYSRVHIWRLMEAGEFPRCFKLGPYRGSPVVWWQHEIIQWLNDCAEAR